VLKDDPVFHEWFLGVALAPFHSFSKLVVLVIIIMVVLVWPLMARLLNGVKFLTNATAGTFR